MNWTDCPEVEIVPNKLSGAPIIAHSRVSPGDPIANREEGLEWLAENFSLPHGTVKAVLTFFENQKSHAAKPPLLT